MTVHRDHSLKSFNTFGVEARAAHFATAENLDTLKSLLQTFSKDSITILGGGSNILLTQDLPGLTLHIGLKGISIVEEDDLQVLLEVQAGEQWHDLVLFCLDHNYGGIENLALIPGQVGTAPIQNIGAYGVEIKDVLDSCVGLHKTSLDLKTFDLEDCAFGYRDSVFKQSLKGQYLITSVRLRLRKKNNVLKTNYGAIAQVLKDNGITDPNIQDVAKAVIDIRQSKLPDPKQLGNSGSFFKNPVIAQNQFDDFRVQQPAAPFFEMGQGYYKIPAGWLIEQAGFKGYRQGDAGVHEHQALVLVNHGTATGQEIWALAQNIQQRIKEVFGITLEPEVNLF